MAVGAPVRVPISSGAIIVSQATARTGASQFSFKVVGTEYTWYEKPFVGLHVSAYYLFLITLVIAVIGFVVGPLPFLLIPLLIIPLFPVILLVAMLFGLMLVPCLCCCAYSFCKTKKK